jgi:hypothetical protein
MHCRSSAFLAIGVLACGGFAEASPIGFSVRAHTGDRMFAIDLATGFATDLGQLLFGDAEGLASLNGQLLTIGGAEEELWNITSAPGAKIGNTGPRTGGGAGLAETSTELLYNIQGDLQGYSTLYGIAPTTGLATEIGWAPIYADSLAINAAGQAFAVDGIFTDSLYTVNLTTGAMTLVGSLGLGNITASTGLSFDPFGDLWMITDINVSQIYRINVATGQATHVAPVTIQVGGQRFFLNGFQSLSIPGGSTPRIQVPEPATTALVLLGLGLGVARRYRR